MGWGTLMVFVTQFSQHLSFIFQVGRSGLFTTLPDTQVVAIKSLPHSLISGLLYGLIKRRLAAWNY